MKKFSESLIIQSSDFLIVPPNSHNVKTKKQIHEMILYKSHYFKRLSQSKVDSWISSFQDVKMVYECSHSSLKCHSKFVLMNDGSGRIIDDHNVDSAHAQDIQTEQRHLFSSYAREKLDNYPDMTPEQITMEYVNRSDYVISPYTPERDYMIQKVNKIKTTLLGKVPKTIDEIKIEDLKKNAPSFNYEFIPYTVKHEKFKALLIYSDFQKELMMNPNVVLLADGTFEFVPKIFKQMFTIHRLIGKKAFPVCFILSVNRKQEMYEEVFKYLRDKFHLQPKSLTTDFELASRNAFKKVFPDILLKGCHFHFTQSLIKKVKYLELGEYYNSNKDLNLIIKYYMNLCFIEISEMEEYLGIIEIEIEKIRDGTIKERMNEFKDYFRTTWMSEHYTPIDWNQLSDIAHRSNNWAESFHSCFGKKFNSSHPNINKLMVILEATNKKYKFEYQDALIHNVRILQDEYDELTMAIDEVIKSKDTFQGNKLNYLQALSTVHHRLLLKLELEILINNGNNPERVKKIERMLRGEEPPSIIENRAFESEFQKVRKEKNEKKMCCITSFYLKKKRKEIEKMKGARDIKLKLKRMMKRLDIEEVTELTDQLNKIENDMIDDETDMLQREMTNNKSNDEYNHSIDNQMNEVESCPSEMEMAGNQIEREVEVCQIEKEGMCNEDSQMGKGTRLSISIIPRIDSSDITNQFSSSPIRIEKERVEKKQKEKKPKKAQKRKKLTLIQKLNRIKSRKDLNK